jgi:hypothetical protein
MVVANSGYPLFLTCHLCTLGQLIGNSAAHIMLLPNSFAKLILKESIHCLYGPMRCFCFYSYFGGDELKIAGQTKENLLPILSPICLLERPWNTLGQFGREKCVRTCIFKKIFNLAYTYSSRIKELTIAGDIYSLQGGEKTYRSF